MAEMRAISYSSVDAMIASVALPWCWGMGPVALRRTGKVLWRKREKEERGVVCAGRLIVRPGDRNTSHTPYISQSQGIAPSWLVIRSRRHEYLAKIVDRSLYKITARMQTV